MPLNEHLKWAHHLTYGLLRVYSAVHAFIWAFHRTSGSIFTQASGVMSLASMPWQNPLDHLTSARKKLWIGWPVHSYSFWLMQVEQYTRMLLLKTALSVLVTSLQDTCSTLHVTQDRSLYGTCGLSLWLCTRGQKRISGNWQAHSQPGALRIVDE